MIELAHIILNDKGEAVVFADLVKEIQGTLGMSKAELEERIAQFYTDLNIDGRFIYLGEKGWGIRSWYPYEQIDEEVIMPTKIKKKRSKKIVADLDLDEDNDLIAELDEDELLIDEDELLEDDLLDEDELLEDDLLDEDEDIEDEELLIDEDELLIDEDELLDTDEDDLLVELDEEDSDEREEF